MPFTFRIQINARPEDAFGYVSDMTRHPEWANPKASLKVEAVSGGAPMVGSKYRSEGLFLKKPVSADLTITEHEAPSRFGYAVLHHQAGKKDLQYHNTYVFRAKGNGTLVEKTTGGGPPAIIGFLVYPAIRADALKSLRNLKAKLESGAS